MKVIFLDIDGVLNSNDWYVYRHGKMLAGDIVKEYPLHEFDPKAIVRLNKIIAQTGAKIIVSSTWRKGRRIEDLQELLTNVGCIGEVIDITPSMYGTSIGGQKDGYTIPRGCEIDWSLNKYGFSRIKWSEDYQDEVIEKAEIKNYVILDDDSDMLYDQTEHFINCDSLYGLTDEEADKSIEILNKTPQELYN
jgi:hypothetical protein